MTFNDVCKFGFWLGFIALGLLAVYGMAGGSL